MKKAILIIAILVSTICATTVMGSSPDKPAGTRNYPVKKFHYDKSVKSSTLNCKKTNLGGFELKGKSSKKIYCHKSFKKDKFRQHYRRR